MKNKYKIISLMKPLSLDVEVFPGDPKPSRKIFSEIKKTGWQHYIHEIGDHNFSPHCDGPNHQNPEKSGIGVEVFNNPVFWYNSCTFIDLSNSRESEVIDGIKYLKKVELKHLEKFEKELKQNSAVIIRTGYDLWLEKNKPHVPSEIPYLSENAAKFLSKFENLNVVGIDSLTVDAVGKHNSHQLLKNKMILESLVNCYSLPKEFTLVSVPTMILGATGAPVGCFAILNKE